MSRSFNGFGKARPKPVDNLRSEVFDFSSVRASPALFLFGRSTHFFPFIISQREDANSVAHKGCTSATYSFRPSVFTASIHSLNNDLMSTYYNPGRNYNRQVNKVISAVQRNKAG